MYSLFIILILTGGMAQMVESQALEVVDLNPGHIRTFYDLLESVTSLVTIPSRVLIDLTSTTLSGTC